MTHCGCVWKEQEKGPPFIECHYHATMRAENDALAKDAESLLRRARAIINRWQELYGEYQPQFLPPAHQIEWAEDASEFIDAAREKPLEEGK